MAADLRLVAHAAQRHADELAVGAAGDGLGERGLAHAGGADQAEDRALGLVHELAHGQELDDALLDLLQAVVVLVQDALRAQQVLALAGALGPRHRDQPVQVVAGDGGLGGHGRHRLQALQLLEGPLLGLLGHARELDLLAELLDLVQAVVLAAELLLDRLHLLVEVVLLLRALHLLLDPPLDALVDLQLVDLALEDGQDALQAVLGREDVEQVLLLLHRQHQVRGDGVRQLARVLDPHRGQHGVVVEVVGELHVLLEQGDDLGHHGLDAAARLHLAGDELHHHLEEALLLLELEGAPAVQPLHQHLHVAVGELQALHDVADGAQGVDLLRPGVVPGGVVLRGEEDPLALQERVLQGLDRAGPPDDERHHHVGEDHHVTQRDQREGLDHVHLVLVAPLHPSKVHPGGKTPYAMILWCSGQAPAPGRRPASRPSRSR